MNLYGYVGGDPVNRSDPTGLEECYEWAVTTRTVWPVVTSEAGTTLGMPYNIPGVECVRPFIGPEWIPGDSTSAPQPTLSSPITKCYPVPTSPPIIGRREIARMLPRRSVPSQISHGVGSYIRGVAFGLTGYLGRTGVLGPEVSVATLQANITIATVLSKHPGQTLQAATGAMAAYSVQTGTRFATGALVSRVTGPIIGPAVSLTAIYGNGFEAALNYGDTAQELLTAMVAGEICTE
jgi:hypothetical protein